MTIITSTSQLVLMPLQGICQGGQPIISFNYGAKNKDRVKKAFFTQFKVCVIFTCVSWVIMMLVPQVFAVFLAEPISDIIAATVTTIVFMVKFDKILNAGDASWN